MEDEDGYQIPEDMKSDARKLAKRFFWQLLRLGQAPAKWGDIGQDVSNELTHQLETEFPWLRFCEGHWKAKKVPTNSYSQWYPEALARLSEERASQGIEVIDVDAVVPRRRRALKRRVADDDGAGPSKRPHLEEAPSGAQSGKPTTNRRRVRILYRSRHSIPY
jgi:hypothetical protein